MKGILGHFTAEFSLGGTEHSFQSLGKNRGSGASGARSLELQWNGGGDKGWCNCIAYSAHYPCRVMAGGNNCKPGYRPQCYRPLHSYNCKCVCV